MKHHFRMAQRLTDLLENNFSIFGFRFGLDPILGLFTGIGDVITLIVGFYFIWIAKRLKIPDSAVNRMMTNIMVDFVIGAIPFIGDIFDFSFRAHVKNMDIIKSYAGSDYIEDTLDSVRTT